MNQSLRVTVCHTIIVHTAKRADHDESLQLVCLVGGLLESQAIKLAAYRADGNELIAFLACSAAYTPVDDTNSLTLRVIESEHPDETIPLFIKPLKFA